MFNKFDYRKCRNYKFQLLADYVKLIDLYSHEIETPFICLSTDGLLTIQKGYAWNGANAIPDTLHTIEPSLVHDALYQLLREGELHKDYREYADKLMRDMCYTLGAARWYAWVIYQGLRVGGGPFAKYRKKK